MFQVYLDQSTLKHNNTFLVMSPPRKKSLKIPPSPSPKIKSCGIPVKFMLTDMPVKTGNKQILSQFATFCDYFHHNFHLSLKNETFIIAESLRLKVGIISGSNSNYNPLDSVTSLVKSSPSELNIKLVCFTLWPTDQRLRGTLSSKPFNISPLQL